MSCCFAAGALRAERVDEDDVPVFLRAVLPEDARFRVPVLLPVFLRVDVLFFFVEDFFVAAKKDYTYFFLNRRCLKTKKMTNISQRRGRFEAKTRRNPSGFQVLLTKKQPAFAERVKIFDFSDTP